MTRRCSHCNSNGHTIRTCSTKRGSGSGGGLRLFGVRLTDGSFKKSASMGSLSRPTPTVDSLDGYHSDDADRVLAALRLPITRIRKRGIPWTENEHRQFLLGLEKCGKGHWLAISQGYVPSRTPSQVASHAQKYFIRQTNPTAPERRRPSLFDIKQDMETEQSSIPSVAIGTLIEKPMLPSSQEGDTRKSLPSLDLSLKPAFTPFPFYLWPPSAYSLEVDGAGTSHGQIMSSVPVVHEGHIKEVVGISELTLEEKATIETESSSF